MKSAILTVAVLLCSVGLGQAAEQGAPSANEPAFIGRVVVEWIEHDGADRAMRLIEPFSFRDSNGKDWEVPRGAIVDGASIPRAFWTLVGPPFVGDYRRASVVHDHYCETKTEPWRGVHRMFYEGVLAAGVPAVKAKVMYAAVRRGGPRWDRVEVIGFDGEVEELLVESYPTLSEDELRAIADWVEKEDPTLDELDLYLGEEEGEAL